LQEIHICAKKLGQKPVLPSGQSDVDPQTHPYISTGLKENKFGIDIERSLEEYRQAKKMSYLDIKGGQLSYRVPTDEDISICGCAEPFEKPGLPPQRGGDGYSLS